MSLLQQIANKLGSSLDCRLMEMGDRLPEEFRLNVPKIDREWTWVAEENGRIVAAVFAGPYHGAVMIGNIFGVKRTGPVLGLLLRRFIRDCQSRGFSMYFTFLERDSEGGHKLASILQRANSVAFDMPHILIGGKLDDLARF